MVKEGYKQTEIGVIPEDWEVFEIGELLKIKHGKNQSEVENSNGIFPILGTGGEIGKTNSFLYDKPSILIGRKGTIDKPKYIDVPFWTVDTLFYSEVMQKVDVKFLFFKFCMIDWHIYNEASGVPSLNSKTIESIQIAIPPKPEQKAIAKALTDTDRLITSLETLIEKKENIKTATMQQLLTGKKRLNGFSGEWVERKLGDVAKIIMGHSPSSSNYNLDGIGLPLIQGNTDIKERKTIISKYTSQITRKAFKNDVIMSVRAPVGKIAKATFEACIGRGVCAIRIKNDFLYHYLMYLESKWLSLSTGSTFDSVTSDEVKSLLIYLPEDEKEQQAIAKILLDMDKEIEALKTKLKKTKVIKKGMMQELLTGRVRLLGAKNDNI